ncbi:HD family hydrolase [Chthonobacter rhizosphaerae]|uniref:HD family hydrolase n=1 Tax=Chthonobacter rhizosphaerae TaxID=2735553 RepID=UPI0015EE87B7|nr:HD family hydrolase [Chthonobacter rhizosphaerae]
MSRAAERDAARAWQRMLSGRRLDLLDPSPLDVEIGDIAHGLARVARWNGQTVGDHAFSVAQHSLLVEDVAGLIAPALSPRERLTVLLHDAPEYVIGDMISPFKAVMGGAYKTVEARLAGAIHQRFGLPAETPEKLRLLTKKADRIAAYFEAVELAGFSDQEARKVFGVPRGIGRQTPEGPRLGLSPWPTPEAQDRFLERFAAIERFCG